MKILVIAPQPFFSPRGTPFSVYYRTFIESELGLEIDLLTYGQGQDVVIPRVNIIRIPDFKFLGKVKVGPSVLKLFLDFIMILKAISLLLKKEYDVVHAHEEAVFFCYLLKPLFGYKLIYDMHSSLPQQLENFKFTESKLVVGVFKALEDRCLESAEAVITICPALADYALSILKTKEKHFMIENSLFDPVCLKDSDIGGAVENDDTGKDSINLQANKKYFVYAGTLEPYQGIDLMLKAFSHAGLADGILLVIGGSVLQVKHYRSLADQLGMAESCYFTGQLSQRAAQKYMSLADVLVSPRVTGNNTPLKVYQFLASGKPIIATRIHSHTQVLSEDVAFLVDPRPEDMSNGMIDALKNIEEGRQKIARARLLYDKKYSRDVYLQKMKALLALVR